MKRIILFWFHVFFDACQSRLNELRALNPSTPIYGLFGGTTANFKNIPKSFRDQFLDIYRLDMDPESSWRFGATVGVGNWFREIGKSLDFEVLNLIEWDLVMTSPLESLYRHIPKEALGLAAIVPMEKVKNDWYWAKDERTKSELQELIRHVQLTHGVKAKPYACIEPGAILPRKFIEGISKIKIPPLCRDEIGLPIYAQAFGIPIVETRVLLNWSRISSWADYLPRQIVSTPLAGIRRNPIHLALVDFNYFNCSKKEISERLIIEESGKAGGHRVFHPIYKPFSKVVQGRT